MIRPLLVLISIAALSACAMSESEIIEAEKAAISAQEADEIQEEFENTQDFNKIAEETAEDMELDDLSALE